MAKARLTNDVCVRAIMQVSDPKKAANIYDFRARDIDGNMVDLDRWVGCCAKDAERRAFIHPPPL